MILKCRKEQILSKYLKVWITKYEEVAKRDEQENQANEFCRRIYINKFMTIWFKRAGERLKKKHLISNVLPVAQKEYFINNYFRAWLALYRRNSYLED